MHTLIMLGSGAILLALCLLLGYWRNAVALTALWFIPVWFIVAAVNMWVGVTKAGYSVMQEVPFFLLVFIPLTLLALIARHMLK
ncbi:hypothetical protein MN202_08890 [Rheinheimera muenzenbergensis]|uniref:Uncharacterized protein n=1 Tax=Rheinheimera muenzenbergensis TaxID=1193628 RepID=A0ABU8C765_9GAMM